MQKVPSNSAHRVQTPKASARSTAIAVFGSALLKLCHEAVLASWFSLFLVDMTVPGNIKEEGEDHRTWGCPLTSTWVPWHVCTYIHVQTHAYMYAHTLHVYMYAHASHTCMHVHIPYLYTHTSYTYMYAHLLQTFMCAHISHLHVCTCIIHVCIYHLCVHTYTNAYMCTYAHTYLYAYAPHTHTTTTKLKGGEEGKGGTIKMALWVKAFTSTMTTWVQSLGPAPQAIPWPPQASSYIHMHTQINM